MLFIRSLHINLFQVPTLMVSVGGGEEIEGTSTRKISTMMMKKTKKGTNTSMDMLR